MDKKEVLEFLQANPTCHVATVDKGLPRVRAIRAYRIDENGIILQVWKDKDIGGQLAQNPDVELCFNNYSEGVQVRVRGRVELVDDAALFEQVLIDRPNLRKFVDQGHEIVIYRLRNGLAHIWTMQRNFEPKNFIEL